MKNNKLKQEQNKKPVQRKYKLVVILLLCVLASLIYFTLVWKSQSQRSSELIIRQAAAAQLNKDPNELTNADFTKIEVLSLTSKEIWDITLLEKFTNLQKLHMSLNAARIEVPKWKKILVKLGIMDIPKSSSLLPGWNFNTSVIDLSPLEKLYNLHTLNFLLTQIEDIKPLAGLINLKTLDLSYTGVSDLEPIRKLKNLQTLFLLGNPITDLEPLKALPNLRYLNIRGCDNITKEKAEDLQNALPNIELVF